MTLLCRSKASLVREPAWEELSLEENPRAGVEMVKMEYIKSSQIHDATRGLLSLGMLLFQTLDEAILVSTIKWDRHCLRRGIFVPAARMRLQVVSRRWIVVPEPTAEVEQYLDLVASLLLSSWELLGHRIEGIDYLPPHSAYSMCPQECPATLTSRSQDTLLATVPKVPYNLVARYRERRIVEMY